MVYSKKLRFVFVDEQIDKSRATSNKTIFNSREYRANEKIRQSFTTVHHAKDLIQRGDIFYEHID